MFAAGENLVAALLFVPLSDGRVLVHVLDDIAPADACIVCTEADLALLRSVRDDAHLGTAEIVIKQVLEPHSGNKQEVPRVLPAFLDVGNGAARSVC